MTRWPRLWLTAICVLASTLIAQGQTLYWDANGVTAGAGTTPAGTWGTDAFWSTDALGASATAAWVSGRNAVFSAGSDATGAFTVTVSGTQTASAMTIEEGSVTILGGAVALATGNLTVNAGATLSTDSSLRITSTAGATLNINGGTLRSIHPSTAGTFIDQDFIITIGAPGATFVQATAGINTILQDGSAPATIRITGPGGLTKSGPGVLSIAPSTDYQGPTIVTDGELRIRTTANRLPITTAVTVTSPGILNLNAVSQQIGSLAGSGDVGLGNATLTVGDGNNTLLTGNIKDTANAGASPSSAVGGKVTKVGAGTLSFAGTNAFTGLLTLSAGGITVNPAAVLSAVNAPLTVNGGTLTLNNAAHTAGSFNGVGGTVTLGSGHTLTLNPTASSTYSGTIAGAGGITKISSSTQIFAGANSYDGVTLINVGRLQANSATALGSTAGGTEVASGAQLQFDGSANVFTIAEPIRIAGPGLDGGAITVQNSANITLSGPVTLTADSMLTVSGTGTCLYNNPSAITSLADQSLTLQGGAGVGGGGTISGTISLGAGGLTKLQGGRWTLSGANVYTGPTLVSAGTLRVANTTGSATGAGDVTVNSGATLSGAGSVAGAVSVSGTITPGASPGTLNTGAETWNGAGSYVWEINNVAGTQGADPGWDFLNISGALNITATAGSKFNLKLNSLTTGNVAGNAANFDNTQEYFWTIATASGGITGFDPAVINLSTSGFSNPLAGSFFVEQSGNSLRVHYIPLPSFPVQPTSVAACPNAPFGFSATIGGPQPSTNQWQIGVTNNVDGITWTNAPNETNATLNFAIASADQTNLYFQLVVSNVVGVSTSSIVRMTLLMDTTPPSINCGQNETLECGLGWGFTVPIVTDDCTAGGVALNAFSTATNFTCGLHSFVATRIWQAIDFSGNVGWCTQVVTVVDHTPPTVTACPGNAAVTCVGDIPPPNPALVAAVDPCNGSIPTVTHQGDVTNGTCPKTVTRTYAVTDACTNISLCVQVFTVNDPTPPTITCPANTSVQCFGNIPAPVPAEATATDNCSGVTRSFVGDAYATNGCVITVTRTYKATDTCNNQMTCTQIITVQDTTPPVINCGANQTVECGSTWSFAVASASDNCDPAPALSIVSTSTNATCGTTYVATRIWQALDTCGNSSTCTQVVSVVDTTAPAITHCATNRVVAANLITGLAPVPDMRGEVSATDCSGSFVVAQTPAPGASVGVGVTVVTLFVSDACHNTNTCTANLTVFIGNAPSASDKGGVTTMNVPFSIANSKLIAAGTDPDNDPLTLDSVSATSTNGGAVVMGATRVTYTPLPGFTGVDRFTFTLGDGHGGTATANMEILVVAGTLPSQNQLSVTILPAGVRVRFAGIPGFTYSLQRAAAASGPWTTLASQVAPLHGLIEYLDAPPPAGSAFYRTVKP